MSDPLRLFEGGAEPPRPAGAALERLAAAWRRRKWLAVLAFALPATAALTGIGSLPALHRSTATVLIERQQVPEAFVRPTVTSNLEVRLHTISQEILSRSRLEGLINRFRLYPDLRPALSGEELVERMRKDIRLELRATDPRGRQGATTAFALSYQGRDPQTVAIVTNTLASFYIEENLKVRERQATGTAEFLKVQLADAKKRLDEQEARLSVFRRRHIGELPEQMQANLSALEALSAQLRINSDRQIRVGERRAALQGQLAALHGQVPEGAFRAHAPAPPAGPDGFAPREHPGARLLRLRQELAAARARYTDTHPVVSRLRGEIAALREEVPEALADLEAAAAPHAPGPQPEAAPAPNPHVLRVREALQEAAAEAKILKAEEEQLRQAMATYRARVENTPRREQELQELSRDYAMTRELYQSLTRRHEEAQLAESMEQRQKGEQFRVLDPAVPAVTPVAPNRVRLGLLAVVLAAGLAAGAVVLAETLDTSFHSVRDLRAFTRVAVLGTIPQILTDAGRRRARWRFRLLAAAALAVLILAAGLAHQVTHDNERLVRALAGDRA
jgi:polysaccharide chain length determinant protein (PEP-CTERM system associated)